MITHLLLDNLTKSVNSKPKKRTAYNLHFTVYDLQFTENPKLL